MVRREIVGDGQQKITIGEPEESSRAAAFEPTSMRQHKSLRCRARRILMTKAMLCPGMRDEIVWIRMVPVLRLRNPVTRCMGFFRMGSSGWFLELRAQACLNWRLDTFVYYSRPFNLPSCSRNALACAVLVNDSDA